MISRMRLVRTAAIVAAIAWMADLAQGESGFRKTLLQWSYGTSFEGGPDLYEPLVTDRPDFTESSVTALRSSRSFMRPGVATSTWAARARFACA